MTEDELEARLARFIEHHARYGELPTIEAIAGDRPDLKSVLGALVRQYLDLSQELDSGSAVEDGAPRVASPTLAIDGFRTIERIGQGGMGVVYKLHDVKLDRVVAAKVLHPNAHGAARLSDFLREAKSMALFSDPRIVRIFEFRAETDPPVIIMEYVDGFELGRIGSSLEFGQRARILRSVCEAVHHAHSLGIQHRDLKPSNIMLDGHLEPKVLDFGLSEGNPKSGHLRGTPGYIAPEQLDPSRPIDARTDVYALGVVCYELLCGVVPFTGRDDGEIVAAIQRAEPSLPVEIDARVPEPLQAVALKAMERDPADRYQSAQEMALDLGRYLDGLPVMARPGLYTSTLQSRVRPHLEAVAEWLRLKLIYPHEATHLQAAYRQLEAREDDWIVASRELSYSQILLYLGAFLLLAGSLFYFVARRVYEVGTGTLEPFLTLGLPFLGLNVAGRWLYRHNHQAVGVAFYLAGVSLFPLFLLIWLHETGWWVVPENTPGQLFTNSAVSNRQLQITVIVACLWSTWLAFRTKTSALSTVATVLLLLSTLAILTDFGLRAWFEESEFDLLALHLGPLVVAYAALGLVLERRACPWFARPFYVAAAVTLLVVLDLLALDGEMFRYLGLSLVRLQPDNVTNEYLMDTVAALTLNGMVLYGTAGLIEGRGSDVMASAGHVLFVLAPFLMLQPLAYLVEMGEYAQRFDWFYLLVAIGIALLSRRRQRRSFYYAGILNTGLALFLIADHNDWFDKPRWAMAVVASGLAALLIGYVLDARRHHQRR